MAREGQIWIADQNRKEEGVPENKLPIGKSLEIESLKNYILQFGNVEKENKLLITIEDRINGYSLEINNPHLDKNNASILHGEPVKGMLAKGPELMLQIFPSVDSPNSQIYVDIVKGKKQMFKDNILINSMDTNRLTLYLRELHIRNGISSCSYPRVHRALLVRNIVIFKILKGLRAFKV